MPLTAVMNGASEIGSSQSRSLISYFSEWRYSSFVSAAGWFSHQLVAGVDAEVRHEGRGEQVAELERGPVPVAQHAAQDVGSVGPEVRAHDVGQGAVGELLDVLGQLLLAVAPREVGVALAEADLGQLGHHRRPGERLGEEEHVGVLGVDLGDAPLPERERLGVGVVDPEDGDAAVDPVAQDVPARLPQRDAGRRRPRARS